MKFSVNPSSRLGARVGTMTIEKCQSQKVVLETPCSLTTTRLGQVPHLTPDVLRISDTNTGMLQTPLDTQVHLHKAIKATGMSLKQLSGNQFGVLYSSVENTLVDKRSGFNTNKNVAVWTFSGRNNINPVSFIELQRDVCPDVLEVLHDADVPDDASEKRILKSVSRSLSYLEHCLEIRRKDPQLECVAMIGALLGGGSLSHRSRAAQQLQQYEDQLQGYLLRVPHHLRPDLCQLNNRCSRVLQLCAASLREVSSEYLRVLPGAWRPLYVLRCVDELGVDLFDSSFPSLSTERSAALVFPLDTSNCVDEQGVVPHVPDDDSVGKTSADGELLDRAVLSAYEINLADKKYAMDLSPLSDDCACYTCREKFSRAYIHHLVQVREMLAPLLLQLHNLHHWQKFFEAIRRCVSSNQGLTSYISRIERLELSALSSPH